MVDDPDYGPEAVNVADQRRDPDSHLNWIERVIRTRRECPEIGWGAWEVLDADDPALLAIRYAWNGRTLMALHNLGEAEVTASVAADDLDAEDLEEMLGRGEHRARPGGGLEVSLPRYGYRWLRGPLVAVVVGLVGAVDRDADVVGLLLATASSAGRRGRRGAGGRPSRRGAWAARRPCARTRRSS